MFELEVAIAGWKRRLAATGSCTGDSLAELESHLRDSHVSLAAKGLDAEESFLLATHRIGDPGSLQAEYAKEHPIWRHRLLWMLVGVLSFQCLIVLAALFRDVSIFSVIAMGARGRAVVLLAIALTVVGYATAACATFFLRQRSFASVASRPLLWVVAAVSFLIVGNVLSQIAWSGSAYFLRPLDLGNLAILKAIVNAALTVLIPLALGITIARLRPPTGPSM